MIRNSGMAGIMVSRKEAGGDGRSFTAREQTAQCGIGSRPSTRFQPVGSELCLIEGARPFSVGNNNSSAVNPFGNPVRPFNTRAANYGPLQYDRRPALNIDIV